MIFHRSKTSREHAADPRLVPSERFVHELHSDPFLDWVIILSASLALVAALVAVDISVYLDTEARLEAPASSASATPKQAIDTVALQATVGAFNERAAKHSALIKGYSAFQDPSLP